MRAMVLNKLTNTKEKIMSKKNNVAVAAQVETAPQVEVTFDAAAYIKEAGSISAAIRKLNADGKKKGEIAKMLNKRYQHVRNVLITPIKKG